MKHIMQHKLFFSSLALFFSLVILSSLSCRRNKDCELIINVKDGKTGDAVGSASVHVYPSQTGPSGNLKDQDQTSTTDAAGVCSFVFKLPAILQAEVTPPAPFGKATAPVKLEEGKSTSYTIKVY